MTTMESARLTPAQARDLTAEVRADVRTLWAKVLDLYEGGAHLAMGYGNWRAYWEAEFGGSGGRGEQLVRAGRVVRALEAAGVEDLPANDSVARQLMPVYRAAPEELGTVWTRAVEVVNGAPTTSQLAEIVEPYRRRRGGRDGRHVAAGAATKRRRNLAGVPIIQAHSHAASARANVDNALDADEAVLTEWLEHADEAARLLAEVSDAIRAHLAAREQFGR